MLTEQQLEERRLGLGGSDIPAILGLSPWKTPLDVYYDKTGEADPLPVDDGPDTPIYWGNVLEDLVAEEYAKRTGNRIRRHNSAIVHQHIKIARANLDRIVIGGPNGPGVLEVKTARNAWGDEIPDYYLPQVVHYLAVTGYQWADVAVLFLADRKFRIYHVDRDDEICTALLSTEEKWWNDHVVARVPPEPMSVDDMARAWPIDSGREIIAPEDIASACYDLSQVREELKQLDEKKRLLELRIKKAMGDAATLISPDGSRLATWKSSKPTKRTDWKAVSTELAELVPENIYGNVATKHTKETAGSRRFLPKV